MSHALSGGMFVYEVGAGDSLTSVGARYGEDLSVLANDNGLKINSRLKLGILLLVDNQHVVPPGYHDGLLINLPQRMLFHFKEGKLLAAYPIAVGKPSWPTPTGDFFVRTREQDKPWIVPRSIQAEMEAEGKVVLTKVPPGPDNPLGRYWLGLSLPGYGIHGTIAPSSIYKARSHGCMRMHPDDIEQLFNSVTVNEPGRIIYQPVLLAQLDDGSIYLEVHRDIYNKKIDALKMVRELAEASGVTMQVDWDMVRSVIKAREGVARLISRLPSGEAQ